LIFVGFGISERSLYIFFVLPSFSPPFHFLPVFILSPSAISMSLSVWWTTPSP
jgi:hypothetical protein